jgi:hypothetical protein
VPPLTPSPLDAVIPVIIALLKQSGWDTRWNALLALAIYVVWTGLSLTTGLRAVDGPVTLEVFISSLVTAMVTGFVSYKLVWSNLGEQTLEERTSVFKGPISEPILDDDQSPSAANG